MSVEVNMIRNHLNRALTISAVLLLASGASAQSNNASPQGKANAAPQAQGAGAKADDKKADDKKADGKAKGDDKAKADDKKADDKKAEGKPDREARKAKEHEAQKQKLHAMLKGPMDEATKQELRRHAERLARLERIKAVATDAKDKEPADRAAKLMEKETARHDKWMSAHSGGAMPTTATPAATGAAVPAVPAAKGGAQ